MCAAVQGYLGPKYRMAANAHYKSKKFLKKLIRTTYRNRGDIVLVLLYVLKSSNNEKEHKHSSAGASAQHTLENKLISN